MFRKVVAIKIKLICLWKLMSTQAQVTHTTCLQLNINSQQITFLKFLPHNSYDITHQLAVIP